MGVNEKDSNAANLDKREKGRNIARVTLEKKKEKKKTDGKAKHTEDLSQSQLTEENGLTLVGKRKDTNAKNKEQVRKKVKEKKTMAKRRGILWKTPVELSSKRKTN